MNLSMLVRFLPVFIILFLFSSCGRPSYVRHDQSKKNYSPAPGRTTYYTASWYGDKFHGRRTASGEVYDMYALTAAHKRLPFGARLRVTYEKTGQTVDVTINDRGPFIRGRDLDLSYGAAHKIGLDKDGVGKVKVIFLERDLRYVKYIDEADSGAPIDYAAGSGSNNAPSFTIQFGAFQNRENALRLKQALDFTRSGASYISKVMVKGRKYYRVRLGTFSSRSEALSMALAFAEEGYTVRVFAK